MLKDLEETINSVAEFTSNLDFEQFTQGEKPIATRGLLTVDEEHFISEAKRVVDQSIATQSSEGALSYGSIDPLSSLGTVGTETLIESDVYKALADPAGMAFCALMLYERTGDDRYLSAAERQYEFLQNATRTDDGGISHHRDSVELWVDSIYYLCPFFAKYGRLTDHATAYDEAVEQIEVQTKHLRDTETGLFRHIWRESPNTFPESSFWSRGNGWVAVGIVDTLEYLPNQHPKRARLTTILADLIDAVIDFQDASGLWHNVLDDNESYLEISGSLMFAYTIRRCIDLGIFEDKKYFEASEKTIEVCTGAIDKEGKVQRTAQTPGGPTATLGTTLYGQGFFLLTAPLFVD